MERIIYDVLIRPAIPFIIGIGIFLSIIFLICELMNADDTEEKIGAVIKTIILLAALIIAGIVLMYCFSIIAIVVLIFAVILTLKP